MLANSEIKYLHQELFSKDGIKLIRILAVFKHTLQNNQKGTEL